MPARFLLGPAGSGKTFRCLAEIRAELARDPAGPPLILLAPKQATFQLERQLLAGSEVGGQRPEGGSQCSALRPPPSALRGYARLQIFSFDRLARYALEKLDAVAPSSLSEEGRVMVLRALLLQRASGLKRFDKSARRPGFAKQLSGLLAELQSHGLSAPRLAELSARKDLPAELAAKLHDLGLLLAAYTGWLAEHELQDANHLLDFAATTLRGHSARRSPLAIHRSPDPAISIAALWLDGFAEMTPAELDLLAAVLPHCERATLAFCLDHEPRGAEPWLSIWAVVGKTFSRCRERVTALTGAEPEVELLARDPVKNRFTTNPPLAHLESHWSQPQPLTLHVSRFTFHAPRLVACADPDAEAAFAAREVLKFVRGGGRFREAAVLVRQLDGYQKPLERAFRRYGVPFFLDRREGVAHHPLAELTRSALRTVAFDWAQDDWFAALKAGFAAVDETEIDALENESLARGWRGAKWRTPIQLGGNEAELGARLERLREKLLRPFSALAAKLASFQNQPTGAQLAGALRDFWEESGVERTLEQWSVAESSPIADGQSPIANRPSALHATVWAQMNSWLDNLALAFPREALPLRDWLPVLEAGLANLTVGVIPPALDQVLIGAIDRSRNPDLKLAFVLGLNEGVFPAAPATPLILSEDDRAALDGRGVALGADLRERLARERYFGYIACTRSSERLVLTFAHANSDGKKLNVSPFVAHVQRMFPELETEEFTGADWRAAEHAIELVEPLMAMRSAEGGVRNWEKLRQISALGELDRGLRALKNPQPDESLSPALAEKIFGPALNSSVSRLEEFAKCPFRFLVHSGLRAEERKVFELDFREQGSFQHDVLKIFHEQLAAEGKRWRDLAPVAARERVGRIADGLLAKYRDGLLRDSAQTQFTARVLTRALQDFIEVITGWMQTRYQFDPARVELGFGREGEVPAWTLALGGGRELRLNGRIDRVDLFRAPGSDSALCVVMDYKSSAKKLDPVLLEHGVQLQLLSYLTVLRHWPDVKKSFGVERLVPAGVFYVNLRGGYSSGTSRAALADAEAARKDAYRHTGRFDVSVLRQLDASGDARGEQFNFRLKKDGTPHANSAEVLSPAEFTALLTRVESQLREMGARIFSGEAKVDPYRKGAETPCEYCDYANVCRIDPWTHEYRVLRRADEEADEE
ncbi:MAG: hypothetical protein EXS35_08645 [Pedosphaera sp.]|nr:hypothetical protein [Pedosphaera sp.]